MNPDFRRLFEAAPACMLALTPDLTVAAVTDSYLRATRTRREDIVGRDARGAFPASPDDPEATALEALLRRVRDTKQPEEMPPHKIVLRKPGAEGGFEERFCAFVGTPVLGPEGEVESILCSSEDVTSRVRLERRESEKDRALRDLSEHTEERYGELLEAAPDAMIVVDEGGIVTLANAQAEVLFGYPRAELVGQSVERLVPESAREGHRGSVREFFASPRRRAMGFGLSLSARRKDGAMVPVEIGLSPLASGPQRSAVAAIRDVSERRRLEEAAKRAADRLASAVEHIEEGIALFDADRRLVLCNSTYRAMLGDAIRGPLLGISYEAMIQAVMPLVDLPTEEDRERFLTRRSWEQPGTTIVEAKLKDGRRLRTLQQPTEEGGLIRTIWDLTADMRRKEELEAARAAADAASAAKSEFLSSMSHELRTPLNAILGFAQVLQRDKREPLTPKQRDRVGQILQGGAHLLRLIEDILDLSRIESGRVSVSTERFGIREVLAEIGTTLEAMAADAGVRVEVTDVPAGTAEIVGDRTRFSQILMNYGSNAIKYNRPGGKVTLRVSQAVAGRVRVTVADTGIGIPAKEQEGLFQPFHRAGQENGPIEGTGIGLAITKRLAALMKGTTGFRSTPNEGSEFWVEMPAAAPAGAGPEASGGAGGEGRMAEDRRGLVLYIEDSATNVLFMRDLLSGFEGVELVTAPSAEQGVELARSRPPDVILMDLHLPGMNGIEAMDALRKWPETREIPVIALTSAASSREREDGEAAGFFRYLTKPVNVAELEGTLESLLSTD